MKIKYLSSASVLIQDEDSKIITDPWYIDGEFYGSWCHYPPCTVNPKDYDDIDGIYISHIHPDHFSVKTLEKMNKSIPIFIHKFHADFLKNAITQLGFNVIEVEHDKSINIKNNLNIRILGADNCNPELCLRYFGCGLAEKTFGSTQIDTLCAIDNGDQVIVNTNDCPYPLAETSALRLKNHYKNINFLLFGYSSAAAYPQCFSLPSNELKKSQQVIVQNFLTQGEKYINLFSPNFYMPFAGRYVLGGKKSILEENRAEIDLEDAVDYYLNSSVINQELNRGIILNQDSTFNLTTGKSDHEYIPINKDEKNHYIKNNLSKIEYDYETDKNPTITDFLELIPKCYERFERKRNQLNFSTDTNVLIHLPENKMILLQLNGNIPEIIPQDEQYKFEKFVLIKTDYKLLLRLLRGPKFAHWDNAEVGSHLEYIRNPNIYERGIFYCMCYFHS